jgi:DNA-binding CsgD family transcriptional regulator
LEIDKARILAVQDQRLFAVAQPNGKHLREALSDAKLGKRSLVELAHGAIMLSIVTIPAPDTYDDLGATAVLLFAKPAVCEPVTLSLFGRHHKLTKTEEQVLAILCLGYSTPEIAAQLHVAVSTVRTHVRSLCAKTGASGVRNLVNQVAVLPPVAANPSLAHIH